MMRIPVSWKIAGFSICFAFVSTAFVFGSIDPTAWGVEGRAAAIMIALGMSIGGGAVEGRRQANEEFRNKRIYRRDQ
ncbi:hypothetical protein ACRAQ6_14105 [Erythrobacter sp. HA6-11]